MDELKNLINTIDGCSFGTKIIFLICLIVVSILGWNIFKLLITAISNAFKPEKLLSFFQRLIKIILPLEIKTIAGIINLTLSIGLLFLTVLVYTSTSIASVIGLGENINVNKIILIILTCFVTGISFWGLYKFDKESKAL